MKKYQPSSGSEGEYFMSCFCEKCIHEKYIHTTNDNDKKCDIWTRSMVYDINEKEYPIEWTYDENGKPTCTAFVKWDWGNDGDPDDPDNPNKPFIPEPPNQLHLFPLEQIEKIKEYETRP